MVFNIFYIIFLNYFSAIDVTIVAILLHLIAQSVIIQEAFKYIEHNIDPNQPRAEVLVVKKFRVVKCINELQQIYRYCQFQFYANIKLCYN